MKKITILAIVLLAGLQGCHQDEHFVLRYAQEAGLTNPEQMSLETMTEWFQQNKAFLGEHGDLTGKIVHSCHPDPTDPTEHKVCAALHNSNVVPYWP
jgi:hypothetical protein